MDRRPPRALTACALIAAFFIQGCTSPTFKTGPGGTLSKVLEKAEKAHERIRTKALGTDPDAVASDHQLASKDLDAAFQEMIHQCKDVLSSYETQSTTFRYATLGLALMGAIAGAIIVPALTAAAPLANQSAIAAFGGLSGVTNVAQSTMKETGLTSEEALRVRDSIRAEWGTAMNRYLAAKVKGDLPEQEAAVIQGTIACTNYALFNPSIKVERVP